ncbi:hypothetical protein BCV72DRAFT_339805 [Rhizopus microsporus var. microsporus]|uniref:Uncharacterized protein n=2 Tax=Rhizopus microsporus TaxID=58291 RepID=A0A2G4T6K8_RHIZD|nr:uncharacterized protein RHIMIDRAFT_289400 [Rhizopus microsporus ATCC 52813]ORE00854.1 hypothetical protein BCV72DRAFT_339805 [Rhizopus microsporus var. microsporus]PHZ16638.1 hypothetical protein RHIMIDRAFT_289400 [Rhizopus microsporus ATCC 52813]
MSLMKIGCPEPMDYIAGQSEFIVETIATHSEYLKNTAFSEFSPTCSMPIEKSKDEDTRMKEAIIKRDYMRYTVQDKVRFFDLKIKRRMSASAAANQLEIYIRTACNRVAYTAYIRKVLVVFKERTELCNKRPYTVYSDEDKARCFHLFFSKCLNASAVVTEVAESLTQNFADLNVSRSTISNFMTTECNLSIKQAQFQSVERNSEEKIQQRYDWVQKW